MRRTDWRIGLIGLLLIATLACEEDGPTGPGGPLAFSSLYDTQYSGIVSARAEVIRDEARWAAVWAEIHARQSSAPPRPSVDFAQDMLVLVGIGEKNDGCWSVAIAEVRAGSGLISVRVEERDRHGNNCACTQATTQPVQVVRTSRIDGALSSQIVSRNVSCP
ncbi:MAG TPA: protease complex subunit PrcB family protein [Thermoanaerobaculia bacterium]|jgi:hypothetical protein